MWLEIAAFYVFFTYLLVKYRNEYEEKHKIKPIRFEKSRKGECQKGTYGNRTDV